MKEMERWLSYLILGLISIVLIMVLIFSLGFDYFKKGADYHFCRNKAIEICSECKQLQLIACENQLPENCKKILMETGDEIDCSKYISSTLS